MSRKYEVSKSLIERVLNSSIEVDGVEFDKTKIAFPNSNFTTPKGGYWTRLTSTFGVDVNRQTGKYIVYNTPGTFVIDIFTEKGTGDFFCNKLADEFADLYKNETFDNIRCTNIEILSLGFFESWFHTQVNVSFNFDTCKEV